MVDSIRVSCQRAGLIRIGRSGLCHARQLAGDIDTVDPEEIEQKATRPASSKMYTMCTTNHRVQTPPGEEYPWYNDFPEEADGNLTTGARSILSAGDGRLGNSGTVSLLFINHLPGM